MVETPSSNLWRLWRRPQVSPGQTGLQSPLEGVSRQFRLTSPRTASTGCASMRLPAPTFPPGPLLSRSPDDLLGGAAAERRLAPQSRGRLRRHCHGEELGRADLFLSRVSRGRPLSGRGTRALSPGRPSQEWPVLSRRCRSRRPRTLRAWPQRRKRRGHQRRVRSPRRRSWRGWGR